MSETDYLIEWLDEASGLGNMEEPSQLLQAIAGQVDPIRALADFDQANLLFDTITSEFGFLAIARLGGNPVGDQSRQKWIGLLRWLIHEILHWRNASDPRRERLVAIFVVAQSCDPTGRLWNLFPVEIGQNGEITETLEKLLSDFTVNLVVRSGSSHSIWEKEAVESFAKADEQADWVEMEKVWRQFENAFVPDVLLSQIVRYLYRFGFDRLINITEKVEKTPIMAQIAAALSAEQRLNLAEVSANSRLQFSCVIQTLAHQPRNEELSEKARDSLVGVLSKVSMDNPRWKAWMQAFNFYPVRYPALHAPLGVALATASETAIKAYVDSIHLEGALAEQTGPLFPHPDAGRQSVGKCLRLFREKAPLEVRKLLWEDAHERWTKWRFDEATADHFLFGIHWSELDYAVVGFADECVENSKLASIQGPILAKLELFDQNWYLSLSHCISERNRLLSQLQPYAHAEAIAASGGDWLTNKVYRPLGDANDSYKKMKFCP
jgi:hypothetical protein